VDRYDLPYVRRTVHSGGRAVTLIATQFYGKLSPGEYHVELTPKVKPSTPKHAVVNLHGAGGTGLTVLGWLGDGKPGTPTYVAQAGYSAIAADAGGTQTWGNQAAIDGAERSYGRSQALPGVKAGKVFLIGASMGGLSALNWAAANPNRVAGVALIIPVINPNDVKVNDRGGYASLVNTAHGGTYDEATMGSTKNPRTMAAAGKFDDIPILIFYGLTDDVCVPAEAVGFAADAGPNTTLIPLDSGHDFLSYTSVDNQEIIDFFDSIP